MPLTKQNRAMAMDVLNGMSLTDAGGKYGKNRSRAHQVTLAFCLEYMAYDEHTGLDGKMKGLKALRHTWQNWESELEREYSRKFGGAA